MMRILVIGKNGYISTCFQRYMERFVHIDVDAVSARDGGWRNMDFSGYAAVVNTAGLAHNNARMGTEEQFIELNARLPEEIAEKAKEEGVGQFINMSSMIVYGNMSRLGSKKTITEKTVPRPANIYGRSKLMGEKQVMKLNDEAFHVAIIRSPLVYGETAVDNFLRLTNYAVKVPLFPNIRNARSMIYSDNLCELIRLIIEKRSSGIFYPQEEQYICTSQIIKDIANASRHRLVLTRLFNPAIYFASFFIMFFRKVFGSLAYDMELSNHFNGAYRIVKYKDGIERIAKARCQVP